MTEPRSPSRLEADRAAVQAVERATLTVRLAGDIGDNVRLVGNRFSQTLAQGGYDLRTLFEPAAEIRAPAGSLAGVCGFQIQFGRNPVQTPGDRLDVLVAFNPAALKIHLPDLAPDGVLLLNRDAFRPADLDHAGYTADPLADVSLAAYRVLAPPLTTLTRAAIAPVRLGAHEEDRLTRFFVLGLLCWLVEQPLGPTLEWIAQRFEPNPSASAAATRALWAGYHHGETRQTLPAPWRVASGRLPPGRYRQVSGGEALALGLVAAARRADLTLVFAGHPSPPAVELLHRLAGLVGPGVRCFQAEDEAAAACAALGASFGGAIGVTATSGPGLGLQGEALGLAVMAELPLVLLDVQRAGPSTGLVNRTEQADLLLALHGRHGECPTVVLAPASPADCFDLAFEAIRLAVGHMTPVVLLADAFLASAAEVWRVPVLADLPAVPVPRPRSPHGAAAGATYQPYQRDERQVRPWAVPGTPGLEHRLGGLEKGDGNGQVSYAAADHEHMVRTRARKLALVPAPSLVVDGPATGDLLVVGWGSTHGAIATAVARARQKGQRVAQAHLRYLNPLPPNTGDVLRAFRRVLVPELNGGQLRLLLRATFLVDAIGLNKVQGQPLRADEVEQCIEELLGR
jgi:2-oxoglutarate ferredoxin oxidoreductase subunit alpha